MPISVHLPPAGLTLSDNAATEIPETRKITSLSCACVMRKHYCSDPKTNDSNAFIRSAVSCTCICTTAHLDGPIRLVDDFRLEPRIVPVFSELRQSSVEGGAVFVDREASRGAHVGAVGDRWFVWRESRC